ncbi:MAG: ABC transporter permease [Bryobacteraceae bacterium]
MNNLLRDFVLALRLMRKSPGTTAVIVLALALGIGVNTSSFITTSALVLHPLPFPDIGRVMTVWETVPKAHSERDAVAAANFLDWKQQSRLFEHLAAFQPWDVNLTGLGDPERAQACLVSPEYFAVLGMKPMLGRTFRADEAEPGHAFVIVVSHGFWERHLASAPDVLGRRVALNGQSYTIAGVMPSRFDFPLGTDIWAPLAMTPAQKDDRATHSLAVMGRLKPGVPVAQARAELETLSRRLEKQHPDTNEGRTGLIKPILELTNNVTDRFVLMLMATAGFVLLLACANVANLQLARVMSRQKEMAVRTAMGASRLRIVRQLVVENVAIALVAGALGLVLAAWNLSYTHASVPAQVRKWVAGFDSMRIDTPVVLFTLAASVVAGILCALPSFLQITRRRSVVEVNEALKESSRSSSAGPRRSRMRNSLATAEVALALILLVAAGLMVRTFQRLLAVNCGYNPNNLLTLQIALPDSTYRTPVQITGFYDRLLHNLQTTPDVKTAGAAAWIGGADAVYIQGRAEPRPGEPRPNVRSVAGQYFAALGLPIVSGRPITEQDGKDTQAVVVLSQTVARHYWPNGDAVGQHVRLQKGESHWLTVVGVCGDVKEWFNGEPQRAAYLPFSQAPGPAMEILVRTNGDPNMIVGAVRAAVRNVDPNQPVFDVKSMQQLITEQTSGVRASAVSMSSYAVIALLLAVTGIYAVISYSVVQRTHEIGVRMALGAARPDVLRMILMQGVGIAGVGLAIGVPVALTLMLVMSSLLYNVVLVEPLVFALLTAILAMSAVLAGYVPARRAASIDPLTALRDE